MLTALLTCCYATIWGLQAPAYCAGRAAAAAAAVLGSAAAACRSASITECSCFSCFARFCFCVLLNPENPHGFCHALHSRPRTDSRGGGERAAG